MEEQSRKDGLGFWSGLFRNVFRPHSELELEERWASGTLGNIPTIRQVETGCPSPWLFARVLLFSVVTLLIMAYGWFRFHNVNMLPGLIMIGNGVLPLCVVVFFFELNARRNVSILYVGKLIVLGGALSLLLSLFMFLVTAMFGLEELGMSVAGIAEEIGKLAAVLAVARSRRYPYILNGLLFGAAIGAGFAIYESAGYTLTALITTIINITLNKSDAIVAEIAKYKESGHAMGNVIRELYKVLAVNSDQEMFRMLWIRLATSPLTHVVWTAITAGGFWMVRKDRPFEASMLFDKRFLGCLLASISIHAAWNSSWQVAIFTTWDKYWILGVISWLIVLFIARLGLKQLEAEKRGFSGYGDSIDNGVKEIEAVQSEYVQLLLSEVEMPKHGYDHLGIEDQVRESKKKEETRERPDFSNRQWYRSYDDVSRSKPAFHKDGDNQGNASEGTASRRRWEKYYQNGDDK